MDPTLIHKRILSFFRRTQGVSSLTPIYPQALKVFPNLSKEDALEAYWRQCLDAERKHAEEVGEQVSADEFASLNKLVSLQLG